ncbi:hypothetical protein [Pyxidicoccus xibeiensis]|uniref:hypothetical protein n=1 Tax=Pyxidicoccus xibeiensis TaxID=2906759 RepID=UPI0020A756C6|nr:hypothetical protein [Pyxidicoccus xibeiensis]MCP3143239.1 hypothetical protein [Pyxidicoccus xibeiensis]
MTAPSQHPSFLELDRAALGVRSASLEQHLKTCVECGVYLGRVTQAEPLPTWARALGTDTPVREPSGWRRWTWPVLATAALACGVLVFVLVPGPPTGEAPGYVASKDAPAVAVHIKRGEQVFLWDGRAPIAPEDRLRLSVASGEHRYVTVAARSSDGGEEWSLLFAGPLSSDEPETVLPESWRVDAAPGEERLRIIFSVEPLPGARAVELFSEAPRTEKLWTTEVRLPKTPAP